MSAQSDANERAVQALARSLYQSAARHKPSLFEAKDLLGRMIEWSLSDESLRVALFRFVDVLPSLESSRDIGRHLEEYFTRVDHALGGLVVLAQALHAGTLVAPVVRRNVVNLARRFIAEERSDHLLSVLDALRQEPAAFTLDIVGEATVSETEAEIMQTRYLDLLRRLAGAIFRSSSPLCARASIRSTRTRKRELASGSAIYSAKRAGSVLLLPLTWSNMRSRS
jgi:RHH-type proline utilization regulon transcriptional repressor/proline dehydrogenase/delta 1-pyrroline-5-carboxylate dehydrogenase